MFITAAYIPEMDFDCLHMDEERGCSMAVEHLIHRGYTRIGCICEPLTLNRRDLFYKVMKRFNMPVYPELVSFGQERAERGGYLRMKELLSGRRLPDAVVACYDQMAIGALHAIQEAGLRIPQDIAVIGFDGIPASEFVYGGLTTISCPYDDMAGITVRILLRRMDGLTGSATAGGGQTAPRGSGYDVIHGLCFLKLTHIPLIVRISVASFVITPDICIICIK